MAHGHTEARHYPVPMVWTEVRIVRKRLNRELAESAIFTQLAMLSAQSKKAAGLFKKQIKKLTED